MTPTGTQIVEKHAAETSIRACAPTRSVIGHQDLNTLSRRRRTATVIDQTDLYGDAASTTMTHRVVHRFAHHLSRCRISITIAGEQAFALRLHMDRHGPTTGPNRHDVVECVPQIRSPQRAVVDTFERSPDVISDGLHQYCISTLRLVQTNGPSMQRSLETAVQHTRESSAGQARSSTQHLDGRVQIGHHRLEFVARPT